MANLAQKYSNFLAFYLCNALTPQRMNVVCAHDGANGYLGAIYQQSQHPGKPLYVI